MCVYGDHYADEKHGDRNEKKINSDHDDSQVVHDNNDDGNDDLKVEDALALGADPNMRQKPKRL